MGPPRTTASTSPCCTRPWQLSHEHLLAKLRNDQANLLFDAHQTQLDDDVQLAALADQQMAQLRANVKVLEDAGRTAIRSTQTYIDVLQAIAFRAQRSVEIYTLRDDEAAQVDFSSGFLHPDDEHNFADGEMGSPAADRQVLGVMARPSEADQSAVRLHRVLRGRRWLRPDCRCALPIVHGRRADRSFPGDAGAEVHRRPTRFIRPMSSRQRSRRYTWLWWVPLRQLPP